MQPLGVTTRDALETGLRDLEIMLLGISSCGIDLVSRHLCHTRPPNPARIEDDWLTGFVCMHRRRMRSAPLQMVCSLRGEAGHNSTRCGGGGAIKKKKKKSKPQMFWCAPGMVPVKRDGVVVMMSETELYGDKIQCKCGGWHLPCGTAKGAASWRAHQDTQRASSGKMQTWRALMLKKKPLATTSAATPTAGVATCTAVAMAAATAAATATELVTDTVWRETC